MIKTFQQKNWKSCLSWLTVLFSIWLIWIVWQHIYHNSFVLLDTDPYGRLLKIKAWLNQNDWGYRIIPDVNAPYGVPTQWTKLIDFFFIGSAYLFEPFLGLDQGLYWGSLFWNPFFLWSSAAVISWGVYQHVGKWPSIIAGTLIYLNSFMGCLQGYGDPWRPDHHALQLFFSCAILSCIIRVYGNGASRFLPHAIGLLMSLGFWVSVEFLLFIVWVYGVFWLRWIATGSQVDCKHLHNVHNAFLFGLIAALFIETGLHHFWAHDINRLCPFYIVCHLIHMATTYLIFWWEKRRQKRLDALTDLLKADSGGLAAFSLFLHTLAYATWKICLKPLYPISPKETLQQYQLQSENRFLIFLISFCLMNIFIAGYVIIGNVPISFADSRVAFFFDYIAEHRCVYRYGYINADLFLDLLMILPAGFGLYRMYRSEIYDRWAVMMLLTGAIPLTVVVLFNACREFLYLIPFLSVAIGFYIHLLQNQSEKAKQQSGRDTLIFFPSFLVIVLAINFLYPRIYRFIYNAKPGETLQNQPIAAPNSNSQLSNPLLFSGFDSLLIEELREITKRDVQPIVWAMNWNDAAALPWYLPCRVVMAPYHTNVQGILDQKMLESSHDLAIIYDILKKRGVQYILIEKNAQPDFGQSGLFWQVLNSQIQGNVPWLQGVALSQEAAKSYKLWRIIL